MGNRLSKIVTRTGDDGTTGLGDGSRVRKDDARIAAIGEVDELNSHIGVLLCETLPDDVRAALTAIQHDLFDLGGELCMPGHTIVTDAHLERLDGWLAEYNATLPPLKEFILPGGSRAAALAHVCRTVCRRAERMIVALGAAQDASAAGGTGGAGELAVPLAQTPRRYVNRLSDLMFVLARVLNRAAGGADVLWRHDRGAASGESVDESVDNPGSKPDTSSSK
ncbi:cob(I)yrinic acid a,c-diamide adenosyltransferase [Paraburkholderia sacchari]|uniref:cob(I)yrinic acid a,c-diamide adenosyltransferase n=1 Tax=Paraburkholderia sacchari TaxID=159450 RepID=UPI001BCACA3B|nr:cob(I)yrinic acid a,c-diamide adenosyltransferase [Paraburkholderia sacchari]